MNKCSSVSTTVLLFLALAAYGQDKASGGSKISLFETGGSSNLEKAVDYEQDGESFGILEIKPAYLDSIGEDINWSLSINGKPYSLGEIRLSPNKYTVKLNHECYDSIGFDIGINKGSHEIFDMANKISLKKGNLILSAGQSGEPVSEPIFVNGKLVGKTPFSGTVPLCAEIEIGKNRELVDVELKYNEKVRYRYRIGFNAPEVEKSSKSNYWAALILNAMGAVLISAGYAKHEEMWMTSHDYYVRGQSQNYYDDVWSNVEAKHRERNTLYAIGGTLLALGIGIHIWF